MSERDIEEIIGWTSGITDYGHGWHTPDGAERQRAEVDDLLSWMRDRGEWPDDMYPDTDCWVVGAGWSSFSAPSLRGALVDMTRAFSERTPEHLSESEQQ